MARRRSAALVAALGLLGLAVASAPTSAAPRPAAVLPTPAETSPRLAAVHSYDTLHDVRIVAPPPEPDVEIGIAALADAPPVWGPASTVTPGGPVAVGAPRGVDASVRYAGEGKELWDRIVYVGGVATDDDVEQDGDVYLFTEEGDDVRLTCSPGRETHPVVSPDARWVAFATEVDGTWDIARVPFRTDGPCDPAAVELLAASGTADETWPAWVDETHLVYSAAAEAGDLGDLFLWVEGREVPTPLTDHLGDDSQPAVTLSSDPYHVAFTTTRYTPAGSIAFLELTDGFLAAADEGIEQTVPEVANPWGPQPRQGMEATWTQSNVDRWLAFTSTDGDGRGDVWIAGLTDENESGALELLGERPLVVTPGVAESHPMWFELDAPVGDDGWSATLWYTQELSATDTDDVVSDDGSDPRTILGDGPLDPPTDTPAYEAGVDYSPDGTRVALSERTPDPPGDPPPGLALVLRDAASLEPVPFSYARDDVDADVDPVWSPDGTMLVFVRWTWTPDGYTGPRLWLVGADGTGARPLTEAWTPLDDEYVEIDPSWSPDSAQIVYAASYGTYSTDPLPLLVAPVQDDGTGPRRLTATDTETCECQVYVVGRSPDWSPSGAQVVAADVEVQPEFEEGFVAALVAPTRPMRGELAVLDVGWPDASSEVSDVTPLAGFTFDDPPAPTPNRDEVMGADDPEWSPNGDEIAFTGVRPGQPWRQRDVYAVPFPATDTARRVTGLPVTEHEPAYQPWTDVVLTLASSPLADDRTTTLTATVTNGGPGLAAGGVVTIDLPDGATSADSPGCTTAGDEVTCRLTDPLGRDLTEAFSVPVSLVGVTTAVTTTVGVVTTESPERVVDNNRASVDLGDPGRDGGVGVQLSIPTGTAWVGGLPLYATFTVRNAGTTPAQDVQVTTAYPAFVVPTGLAPCPAPSGSCALGTLGGGAAVVLTATLDPSVVFEGPPQLGAVTASVATTSPDPDPADDTASAPIEVHRPMLTVSPGVARPGEVVFVTGTDFPPGADVSQAWSVGIMGGPVALRADDGRFQAAVPLIADTLLGPRGLRAASPATTPLFGPVETTLLVVATSAQAPSFLFRR